MITARDVSAIYRFLWVTGFLGVAGVVWVAGAGF
jgi:hypothetical protein